MKHRDEFDREPEPGSRGPYRPRHTRYVVPDKYQAATDLRESLQAVRQQLGRLGMDSVPRYYDMWRNGQRIRVYGAPIEGSPDAFRVVVNSHIDNSIDDYAAIFIDDIILANQNIVHEFEMTPMDMETGDTPEVTDTSPPIIDEAQDDRWFLFEGSQQREMPALPRRNDEPLATMTQARLAADLACLLSRVAPVDKLKGFED